MQFNPKAELQHSSVPSQPSSAKLGLETPARLWREYWEVTLHHAQHCIYTWLIGLIHREVTVNTAVQLQSKNMRDFCDMSVQKAPSSLPVLSEKIKSQSLFQFQHQCWISVRFITGNAHSLILRWKTALSSASLRHQASPPKLIRAPCIFDIWKNTPCKQELY